MYISGIIPSTLGYYRFCLENLVLWFLFILVKDAQSASVVAYESL